MNVATAVARPTARPELPLLFAGDLAACNTFFCITMQAKIEAHDDLRPAIVGRHRCPTEKVERCGGKTGDHEVLGKPDEATCYPKRFQG